MNKFDIKDGEYTSTIYGLIKVKSLLERELLMTIIVRSKDSRKPSISSLTSMTIILPQGGKNSQNND